MYVFKSEIAEKEANIISSATAFLEAQSALTALNASLKEKELACRAVQTRRAEAMKNKSEINVNVDSNGDIDNPDN